MKHLYDTKTTLKTESRVFIEANYNRTIHGMTKPGDHLTYQAPNDPSEHPMYVDGEGRNVPVSPVTLQPMSNENGHVVDKNGAPVPQYEYIGTTVHIDDVRIAVTSTDYAVKDQDGKEIYISHDGEIIPTGDDGLPQTVLIDGVAWALGQDGKPYAPLNRVFSLRSYVKPVRGDNQPVDKFGSRLPRVADDYEEYFDINSIVKADRPSRRGVQVAWTSADNTDTPINTGFHSYDGARFYTASEDMLYKYWTSPQTSNASPTFLGVNIGHFDSSWRVVNGTEKASTPISVSADFQVSSLTDQSRYFEKVVDLDSDSSYELSFDVMAQANSWITVELLEWSDDQPEIPNYSSGSLMRPRKQIAKTFAPAGRVTSVSANFGSRENSASHALRIIVSRPGLTSNPKITLTNLSMRSVTYPIAGVGPRALYDRPIGINKIVVGVDYSLDETVPGEVSHSNKPNDTRLRLLMDRGDGLFTWRTVATNPEIDSDGKITLYWDGTGWSEEEQYSPSTATVMGIQYAVHGLKKRDGRVNIMEISGRRVYDVTPFLVDYSVDTNVSEESFVLPFGTVNSNTGKLSLSNHDGRFNSDNKYLLDRERTASIENPVFTNERNPFYQMLNDPVYVTIETATYDPESDEEKQFIRMLTARSDDDINPGGAMTADISLVDDSRLLEGITPGQTFYSGVGMSVIQVIYMILDSVGFTNVQFADEDEHFAAHLDYFWISNDDDNIWQIISDLCQATQTIAFFDEYNVLNFKSLKGMYEDALSKQPAQLFTSEDTQTTLANIQEINLTSRVNINKVNLTYREIKRPDTTPSGARPMEVMWEPNGTEVLRSGPLLTTINNKQLGKGGNTYFQIPSAMAKTWPFSGMIQVEGEMIKFEAKQYTHYTKDGERNHSYIKTEDERKKLDEASGDMSYKNAYSGRIRMTQRGAEGTRIRTHGAPPLTDFTRRYRNGTGPVSNNYTAGLSIKQSKLHIKRASANIPTNGIVSVTVGSVNDFRPPHIGTQVKITSGRAAGVCFGMGTNDDGIFAEIMSTEALEKAGRPHGELHVFTRKNGVVKKYGMGVDVPISLNGTYTLDLNVKAGGHIQIFASYEAYYEIALKYGDKGSNVKVLQTALNKTGERLAVDGSFGKSTRAAVIRLQKRRNMTQNGLVTKAVWQALERGTFNINNTSIVATVDGVYTTTVQIPNAELPSGYNGGRWGVFTRGKTSAEFEYMYAVSGLEDIEPDESNFWDYITGGYVSDQLDSKFIYSRKNRYVMSKGKRVLRRVISDQLRLIDFGPYAHEVRDYDVKFERDAPAIASYAYFSNERDVHLVEYTHQPFGSKFRMINKARHDAILNGEDNVTFGADNAVDQRFMIYGEILNVNDQRSLTISDEVSTMARGVNDISIDTKWVQSQPAAEKLGSHIIESMSNPVSTYDLDVFGHAGVRVGQIVSLYDPKLGLGDASDPINANRFFVTSVQQSNDGTHSTSIGVREVIGSGGLKQIELRDALKRNNNALNANPGIEEFERVAGVYVPKDYDVRSGLRMRFRAPASPQTRGGGAALLTSVGDANPSNNSMGLNPVIGITGRFPHDYGKYYLFTAEITALHDVAAGLVIEGRTTTGGGGRTNLASNIVKFKAGQTKTVVLKGQYLSNGELPELEALVRVVDYNDTSKGAPAGRSVLVTETFYRASQSESDIYPLRGWTKFRKL